LKKDLVLYMITISFTIKKETRMFFKKRTEKKRDGRTTWRVRMSCAFLIVPLAIFSALLLGDTANALANINIVVQAALMFSVMLYPVAFIMTDLSYECYHVARKHFRTTPQQKRDEYLSYFDAFKGKISATERLQIEHYIQDTPKVSEKQIFLKIQDIQKSLTSIKKS